MPEKTQFEIRPAERCLLTLLISKYKFCQLQTTLNTSLGLYFREDFHLRFILAEEILSDC